MGPTLSCNIFRAERLIDLYLCASIRTLHKTERTFAIFISSSYFQLCRVIGEVPLATYGYQSPSSLRGNPYVVENQRPLLSVFLQKLRSLHFIFAQQTNDCHCGCVLISMCGTGLVISRYLSQSLYSKAILFHCPVILMMIVSMRTQDMKEFFYSIAFTSTVFDWMVCVWIREQTWEAGEECSTNNKTFHDWILYPQENIKAVKDFLNLWEMC